MEEDVAQGLLSVLPDFMQQILGIKPTDTPEEANRKKQMLERFNQLTDDQQKVVQQKMKEEQEKKKVEEEEKAKKEQAAQQANQDELAMPQGKTTGEGGPGASSKKRTTMTLQSDR